jgi:Cleft lip and palate transmembrane protein 1 (CLPTM1)
VPLNSSVDTVPLHVDVRTISTMWWQMQLAMESSMQQQQKAGVLRVRRPSLEHSCVLRRRMLHRSGWPAKLCHCILLVPALPMNFMWACLWACNRRCKSAYRCRI